MFLILSESKKQPSFKDLIGYFQADKKYYLSGENENCKNIDDIYYAINSAWSEIL